MKTGMDGISLLATSVVILAGAIAVGLGAIAEALPEHRGLNLGQSSETVGMTLTCAGAVLFLSILIKGLVSRNGS